MLNPAVANHVRAEAKMVYQIAHARLTQINSTLLFLIFISLLLHFRVLRLQRSNLCFKNFTAAELHLGYWILAPGRPAASIFI